MAKRRRFPFMFGWEDEFERMREEMEEMMDRMMEGFEGIKEEDLEKLSEKPYVYGWSIKIGPEGKPIIREFGNRPKAVPKGAKVSEEREPLVDVIEEKDRIKIVAELPGVSKEDIDLKTTEEKLEIRVDTPERKYHKVIDLPCKARPLSAKASYKNGVLEVTLERVEPKKEEKGGFRVKIE